MQLGVACGAARLTREVKCAASKRGEPAATEMWIQIEAARPPECQVRRRDAAFAEFLECQSVMGRNRKSGRAGSRLRRPFSCWPSEKCGRVPTI